MEEPRSFFCATRSCRARYIRQFLPLRDCGNPQCAMCANGGSHYPICETCDNAMREVVHAPAVIWTGPISQRYRDPSREGYHDPDGQIAWTRNTPDGKPAPVHLETWQDVHQFAKDNGCLDPRELPNNMEVSESGKSMDWRGQPGQEI